MLNAEMAETTPTPTTDIFINTTEEVIKVAAGAGDIVDTSKLSVTEYFSNTFGGFSLSSVLTNKCGQWQETNHMYFQLANAFFLIAFLAPHKSYGFLLARCTLVCGSIALALWSYLIECSLDALIWSGLFVAVNFTYLVVLIYQMRPVYFEKEIDAVITIHSFVLFLVLYYRFTIYRILKSVSGKNYNFKIACRLQRYSTHCGFFCVFSY